MRSGFSRPLFSAVYVGFGSTERSHQTSYVRLIRLVMFILEIWFGLYWLIVQSVRWNPFWRFTFADTLSQRYGNDLPRLDVFVCTADPVIEPPSMVVNTVLSVLALDYPPEKLAVYLSDDGGSHQLTFYALSRKQLSLLIHGFRFVRSSTWSRDLQLLTCLPRQTWVSFLCLWQLRVSWKISGGRFILNLDWDMYSNNSKSARDALCILLDEKEGKDIAFVQFPQFYDNLTRNGSMMSVVVAHVRFLSFHFIDLIDSTVN